MIENLHLLCSPRSELPKFYAILIEAVHEYVKETGLVQPARLAGAAYDAYTEGGTVDPTISWALVNMRAKDLLEILRERGMVVRMDGEYFIPEAIVLAPQMDNIQLHKDYEFLFTDTRPPVTLNPGTRFRKTSQRRVPRQGDFYLPEGATTCRYATANNCVEPATIVEPYQHPMSPTEFPNIVYIGTIGRQVGVCAEWSSFDYGLCLHHLRVRHPKGGDTVEGFFELDESMAGDFEGHRVYWKESLANADGLHVELLRLPGVPHSALEAAIRDLRSKRDVVYSTARIITKLIE